MIPLRDLRCGVVKCPYFPTLTFRCGFCRDDPDDIKDIRNSHCKIPVEIILANLVDWRDGVAVKVFG